MAVAIVMPKLGMVMSEGVVNRWLRAAGERVEQGEVIAEIETEKVSYELEATAAGILHPVVDTGTSVDVGGILGYLLAEGEAPPSPPAAPGAEPAAPGPAQPRPKSASARAPDNRRVIPSTPGARKAAAKLGVDLARVSPSGAGGRVTEADVRAFAGQALPGPASAALSGMPEPSASMPLAGARKVIASRMRASLSSTAQLSFFLEIDITDAQRLRRESSAGQEVTVAFADVVMKACARALGRVPALNSVLADGVIHYFDTVNIGLAVAIEGSLVVPVVRNVQDKDLFELAGETQKLAARARAKQLQAEELAGATFTVSVLGVVDGFTPILNAGQTGILGVGRSVSKPVVRKNEIVVREMSAFSLSVDHQVVDGAAAASFMRRLQQAIERPAVLFNKT